MLVYQRVYPVDGQGVGQDKIRLPFNAKMPAPMLAPGSTWSVEMQQVQALQSPCQV
jgi:hypothetical protein